MDIFFIKWVFMPNRFKDFTSIDYLIIWFLWIKKKSYKLWKKFEDGTLYFKHLFFSFFLKNKTWCVVLFASHGKYVENETQTPCFILRERNANPHRPNRINTFLSLFSYHFLCVDIFLYMCVRLDPIGFHLSNLPRQATV